MAEHEKKAREILESAFIRSWDRVELAAAIAAALDEAVKAETGRIETIVGKRIASLDELANRTEQYQSTRTVLLRERRDEARFIQNEICAGGQVDG